MTPRDRWPLYAVAGTSLFALAFLATRKVQTMVNDNSTAVQDSWNGLTPEFREKLSQLVAALKARGFKPWVYETTRSRARQDWLYASGRTRPGPIVTDVDGSYQGKRGHGSGTAADVIDGRPHPTRQGQRVGWGSWTGNPGDEKSAEMAQAYFKAQGEEAKRLGLVWGGDWTLSGGGDDRPHVQLA
jgi:peptidoglycan L-alanyl-D-glutamate endopeptidase CwlK